MNNHTLNFRGEDGTALDQAALRGDEQIVEELLQAGADHGDAMKIAIEKGHEGVVGILIKHGAVQELVEEA